MIRTLALLAALLTGLAHAGQVTNRVMPPFDPQLEGALSFVWSTGCVRSGQYELPQQTTVEPTITIMGLPDRGRCYFAVRIQDSRATVTQHSDELVYDFDRLEALPPTPRTAPLAGAITFESAPVSPFVQGFDFRASSTCAIDPPNHVAVLGTTWTAARTWGWEGLAAEGRDRNRCAGDPRLGGQNQVVTGAGAPRVFRKDLANGRYRIRAAFGETAAANRAFFELRDGTTLLFRQAERGTNPDEFVDAMGNLHRTSAAWIASNAPRDVTISSGRLLVVLFPPSISSSVIAYLQIERLP